MLPPLYAIADIDSHEEPLEYLRRLLTAGAALVQLRSKRLSDNALLELTAAALTLRDELCNPAQLQSSERGKEGGPCKIVVNDRISVCEAAGADGVHLGQEDTSPAEARRHLGSAAIVGLSTHSPEQVRAAPQELLTYIAIGPVFRSPTKSGHAPEVGLEGVRAVRQETRLPVVAIGGITAESAPAVYGAGADSLAVISDLTQAASLAETIALYNEAAAARR